MEVLAGTRQVTGGRVLLGDRDITTYDARTERGAGVAFIPEDRRGTGLVLSFSIAENSILGRERSPTFSWNEFVLKLVAIKEWARRLVKEFDIRTPSIEVAARNLSGGNQQKVIVAREMGSKPKVLLAAAVIMLLLIVGLSALTDYWSTTLMAGTGERLGNDIRESLFEKHQQWRTRNGWERWNPSAVYHLRGTPDELIDVVRDRVERIVVAGRE